MPWSAVAGAVVGGVANNVIGGLFGGGGGGGGGSSTQSGSAAAAADPFASQRGQYQDMLSGMMKGGFTPQDQSYQWRLGQGQQAIERSLGARGLLNSGNRLTELMNYGQGMASSEYQNQFNRLAMLSGVQSGSPGAAGQIMQQNYQSDQQGNNLLGGMIGNAVMKTDWGNLWGGGTNGADASNQLMWA